MSSGQTQKYDRRPPSRSQPRTNGDRHYRGMASTLVGWWFVLTPVNYETAWRSPQEANILSVATHEDFHFQTGDRRWRGISDWTLMRQVARSRCWVRAASAWARTWWRPPRTR